MATTTSTRPPSTSFTKPQRAPSIPNGISSSPAMASKRPPLVPAQPSNGININANSMRASTRQRREVQRPAQPRTNSKGLLDAEAARGIKRKFTEPHVRTTEWILRKFSGRPPSLIVHLHQTHWRFDQQDGSFRYESPMKVFLEHLRDQTVPHGILEELLRQNVQFYDGCLIVEVHNHRTASPVQKYSSKSPATGKNEPFSIHNYNEHITPSPFVPYPSPPQEPNVKEDGLKQETQDEAAAKAMQRTQSQDKSSKKYTVYTTVMHQTELSRYAELSILMESPFREGRLKAKQAAAQAGGATPGGSVSTPVSAGGSAAQLRAPKRKRYMIEEDELHDFEAETLRRSEPPLILDPAANFKEARATLKALTHPLHNRAPIMSEGRKKTTAELAADEAQMADDERLALVMDERLEPSLGGNAANANAVAAEGQNLVKGFEPDFSRFKKLEEIKKRKEEEEEQRKLQQAANADAKRAQQQQQQMAQRRQELSNEQRQRQEQQQQQMQRMAHERAMAAHQQQVNAAGIPANMVAGGQMNPRVVQQMLQQQQAQAAAQAAHGSPVVRNHTPSQSSPLVGSVMNAFPQQGVPMMQNMSGQGPGSPPRPGSAMIGGASMGRQPSQQPSHHGQSQHGTPRMPSATPQVGHAVPRHMTPQPNNMIQAGSPISMNGTPMMQNQPLMGTPQMNGQPQLSAQQIAMMKARQQQPQEALRQQMAQAQQQNAAMQASPNLNMGGHFPAQISPNPQQNMMAQAQQRPPSMNTQAYQQQLIQQQFLQQQKMQLQAQKLAALRQQQQQQQQHQAQQQQQQQQQQAQINQQNGVMPQNFPNGQNMQQNRMGNVPQNSPQPVQGQQHPASNPNHPQHQQWLARVQMQRAQALAGKAGGGIANGGLARAQHLALQLQRNPQKLHDEFLDALRNNNGGELPGDAAQKWQHWKDTITNQLRQGMAANQKNSPGMPSGNNNGNNMILQQSGMNLQAMQQHHLAQMQSGAGGQQGSLLSQQQRAAMMAGQLTPQQQQQQQQFQQHQLRMMQQQQQHAPHNMQKMQ